MTEQLIILIEIILIDLVLAGDNALLLGWLHQNLKIQIEKK